MKKNERLFEELNKILVLSGLDNKILQEEIQVEPDEEELKLKSAKQDFEKESETEISKVAKQESDFERHFRGVDRGIFRVAEVMSINLSNYKTDSLKMKNLSKVINMLLVAVLLFSCTSTSKKDGNTEDDYDRRLPA